MKTIATVIGTRPEADESALRHEFPTPFAARAEGRFLHRGAHPAVERRGSSASGRCRRAGRMGRAAAMIARASIAIVAYQQFGGIPMAEPPSSDHPEERMEIRASNPDEPPPQ
jgi:hypothetical protein